MPGGAGQHCGAPGPGRHLHRVPAKHAAGRAGRAPGLPGGLQLQRRGAACSTGRWACAQQRCCGAPRSKVLHSMRLSAALAEPT